MAHKHYYKKIFVIAAALVVLFAPVGIVEKQGSTYDLTHAPTIAQSAANSFALPPTYSPFHLFFSFNIAEASGTTAMAPIGTTGAAAGAHVGAQSPDFFSCASNLATCSVYYVSLVVNGAMGLLLVGGAYLVQLGLQFNDNIFNAPAVQIGFSISLAIANLGFVLGIIIIAIATILRNQTYGMKQLLWKLVAMAILVNFGLVITAPIVGFANNMSTYFINATSPQVATGGYGAYVGTMMGAFNPQTPALAPAANASTTAEKINTAICTHPILYAGAATGGAIATGLATAGLGTVAAGGALAATWTAICKIGSVPTSDAASNFWQQTMALLFDIAFSAIAAFTFICLAILLLIRYLMLGGLLIVLPLAWLTYIFPKFDNSFSKWWNTFVKWVFFPPLALFFIYLAFSTAAITGSTNTTSSATLYSQSVIGGSGSNATDIISSLSKQTGISGGVFGQAADEVLLVGLMIMGLMFALSLSGKAGSTVVNGATAVTKATAGYVGRKTGRGVARLYQKRRGGELNSALQRNRVFAPIGRGLANLTESATKDQVDARHKALGLGNMDDDRLKDVTQGLTGKTDQLAAVREWQKRGKIDKIEKIGGGNFSDWLKKNQGTFKDFGQGKLSGEIDTSMASNNKIRTLAGIMGAARAGVDTQAITDSTEVMDKNGIFGPAGTMVPAKDLTKAAADTTANKQTATDNVRVVDKSGVLGSAGKMVSAKDLAKAARDDDSLKSAQAIIDNPDSNGTDIKNAQSHKKELEDAGKDADKAIADAITKKTKEAKEAVEDAKKAIADAINTKVDAIEVEDKENLLGHGAGKTAPVGEFRELMQKESESFWEGKDKSAVSKGNSSAIFGNKAKFGLDKETLNEIGRSVAHGIVTQIPGAMGSIAGKLDNSKQLETFTSVYKTSIEDAEKRGKISEERAKELNDALKKVLAGKLAYMAMEESTPAPIPVPTPKS
jgi:hypothetical protein